MSSFRPPGENHLAEYLSQADSVILPSARAQAAAPVPLSSQTRLRVGVDLGTAYLVLVVLAEDGTPLAGEWQYAEVVRDGLVVDFIGAGDRLRAMRRRVEERLGRELSAAVSGYPPGVPLVEARAKAHVLEAAGMDCAGMIGEPSAANHVLGLKEGAIVDVGGGTTGIAVLRDGKVVYTADEPTGGIHFSLVIAGNQNISFEEAEALKIKPAEQPRLLPLVRPVMEKVATIILRQIQGQDVRSITLVGGSSAFLGMAEVVQEYTGIPTHVPGNPAFVTPL